MKKELRRRTRHFNSSFAIFFLLPTPDEEGIETVRRIATNIIEVRDGLLPTPDEEGIETMASQLAFRR